MANAVQCIQLQKSELYRLASGTDAQKFYRRTLEPFVSPEVPRLRLSSNFSQETVKGEIHNAEKHCYMLPSRMEFVQNRGTQTDYRESECQTSPWEPPYKIVPGQNPEVLTLSHLTWKRGLPVGLHEVEIINRMRIRRAWEEILPPMDSEDNIKLRTNIVTALEADDWAFREAEIEFIMKVRMDLAEKVMKTRNDDWDKKKKDRFARLGSSLGQQRDKEIKKIRQKFGRELRKLTMKHRGKIGSRYKCQDIIKQHEDRASELYAPKLRYGENPQRRHEIIKKHFLRRNLIDSAEKIDTRPTNFPTIEELNSIKPKPRQGDLCIRETKWTKEKLEELYGELRRVRLNVQAPDSNVLLENKSNPMILPPTPVRIRDEFEVQNIEDKSAALIQKTIRGRAIQYMMFEGREKYRELIKEFQAVCVIQSQEEEKIQNQATEILSKQHEEQLKNKQESRLNEIFSSLEGTTVSGMMDYLSKEMVKLQDERKAHAFALLAERERVRREAIEAGRRDAELQRRRELDEVFRQLVKVNQDSVEAYLEDIVKEGIDWVSEKEAKKYVMILADKIDSVSKYAAENAAEIDEEEMVSDMVYNFVLPEVEREIMRKKIQIKQQEYLNTAHAAIYDELLNLPLERKTESQNEMEIIDINIPTTSRRDSFTETESKIQESYGSMIDSVIDKIMFYVIPNENEDSIREILTELLMESIKNVEDETLHENSFSSTSSWEDLIPDD